MNTVIQMMEQKAAANKAKEARMAFGEAASLIDAKLKSIIKTNTNTITENGHAGAYQLFAYRYSSSAYKKAAANALLEGRRAIRFNLIYRGMELNQEIRSDVVMDYIADMRQRAFAAGV